MSIYDNGIKESVKKNRMPSQKVDTKKILNNSGLSEIVKQIKNGPKTAREILFDTDDNPIGVLQRDYSPFFFNKQQLKEFLELTK